MLPPRALLLRLVLIVALLPLGSQATQTPPPLRVLFLGNSLTSGHDVPAMVQAMALVGGREVEVLERTAPDYALEDHWHDGAQSLLKQTPAWDVLVMQQGPSTRPESRAHLKEWTARWAGLARTAGTRPALYMVWPLAQQRQGFLLVSKSYREAAAAAGTEIYPAAEAWALALHRQPKLKLYAPDGLHATELGAFLAAITITRGLTGLDPALVPARLKLKSGRVVTVPEEALAVFRTAVAELPFK